tara:strand:+ start:3554 stop:4240 length:687 start_codon:yes stop_codon:yes gene_type:complete
MTNTFWTSNPGILVNKDSLLDLWPTANMDQNSKLNAISRLIILLTVVGFMFSKSMRIVVTGAVTLGIIIFLHYTKSKNSKDIIKNNIQEAFTNPEVYKAMQSEFKSSTSINPMGNVSLPEIQYNPKRKAAPPAFNPAVEKTINEKTKEMVQKASFPDDPTIADKLFKDLGDDFVFDRSMRNFYTTPNTKVVPGDQKAFAEFLYGDMKSCKDGDPIACEKNSFRHIPGY